MTWCVACNVDAAEVLAVWWNASPAARWVAAALAREHRALEEGVCVAAAPRLGGV